MNQRRLLILALGAALSGTAALLRAQARAGVPRIGMLFPGAAASATNPRPLTTAGYRQGLRELGYVEGQNILIEWRYADGRPDRLAALAAELVQLKVDVIFTGGQPAREAARKATSTIPIVALGGSDAVREGWAQSLAHPGGNVTGLTVTFPELMPKCLELLKQTLPGAVRVAVFIDPIEVVDAKEVVQETEAGARQLGLQLQVLEVRGPDGLGAAFSLARQRQAQALFVIAMPLLSPRIAALAASERLPAVGEFPLMAQAGFLMAYGADLDDLARRSITQMDKILKGAHAGDLPIERPTKFQMIVNLKTAKALGITIPQSVLLRADEVIE